MEKIIIKTIREAFNTAYINRLLKESAERLFLTTSLTKEEADNIYNDWINGKRLTWGNSGLGNKVETYIVERAVEDYKKNPEKKIHDAIITFFYPSFKSKSAELIKQGRYGFGNAIIQNLRTKFGDNWQDGFAENMYTAYLKIINPATFEDVVNTFNPDETTFAQHLLYKMAESMSSVAADTKGVARGGGVSSQSLDAPGYDDEGGRKFDIAGGIETSDKYQRIQDMYKLFKDFGNITADLFQSRGKETLSTLAREFFVNGKSYIQIVNDNPDLFADRKPGELSTMMLNQVLAPSSIKNIAKDLAEEIDFPKDWLERLIISKEISSIQDAYKDPKPETEEPIAKKVKPTSGMVFEKFINSNMDAIIQEVYKRLNESYFHNEEEAYIGRTDAYYADEYDGDVYEPEYWTYSTDINDKDFAEGGDLYQLTDEGKEIINSWLDSKEHNEYQRMNARRSGGLSSFANMDKEELWNHLTTDRRYSKQI